MSEWQSIESAPKDGTIIRVKNERMDRPVLAKFGKYKSPYSGEISDDFILVEDEGERFMPLPRGTLIIPTVWQPK